MREDSYWSGFYLEALVLRHFAHSIKQVLGKEERKSEMEGGGEAEMGFKSEFSSCEENATVFFLLLTSTVGLQARPPTVGIPQHFSDGVPLSAECFVRSQDAPHIRGIRLAPVR